MKNFVKLTAAVLCFCLMLGLIGGMTLRSDVPTGEASPEIVPGEETPGIEIPTGDENIPETSSQVGEDIIDPEESDGRNGSSVVPETTDSGEGIADATGSSSTSDSHDSDESVGNQSGDPEAPAGASVVINMPTANGADIEVEFTYKLVQPEGAVLQIPAEGTFTVTPGESYTLGMLPMGTQWTIVAKVPVDYVFEQDSWSGIMAGENIVIAPALVVSTLSTMETAMPETASAGNTSSHLEQFESYLGLFDADYQPVDKDENGRYVLKKGEKYFLELLFQEKGVQGLQFGVDENGNLTFAIPGILNVGVHENLPLTVTINGETITVGTYSIDENGNMTVTLTEEGKKALDSAGDVILGFELEFTPEKTDGGDENSGKFDFAGETFTFDVENNPEASVEKTGSYDAENKKLTYNIKTTVENGPIKDLVITDKMQSFNNPAVTLELEENIKVTVTQNGVTKTLDPSQYELEISSGDPPTFKVKLKAPYNELQTGDEVNVEYNYQAEFHENIEGQFYASVANNVTVTGAMPAENSGPDGEGDKPLEEHAGSTTPVFEESPGSGVIVKRQTYDATQKKLHYEIDVAIKKGSYSPFFIRDYASVILDDGNEYRIVFGESGTFAEYIKDFKVQAMDTTLPDTIPDNFSPGGEWTNLFCFSSTSQGTYDSKNMNHCLYEFSPQHMTIYFGKDREYPNGNYHYDSDRYIRISFDLDVSGKVTLYSLENKSTQQEDMAIVLKKGIHNYAFLRYGHYQPEDNVFFAENESFTKSGTLNPREGTVDYTVSLGLNDTSAHQLMMAITQSDDYAKSIYFEDSFEEGWRYVKDSLKATFYTNDGSRTFDQLGDNSSYYPSGQSKNYPDGQPVPDGIENGTTIKAYLRDFYHGTGGLSGDWLHQAFKWHETKVWNRLEFTYTLAPTEEWKEQHKRTTEAVPVKNFAKIYAGNSIRYETDDSVDYTPPRITKEAIQVGNSNLLQFTIEVNPEGLN